MKRCVQVLFFVAVLFTFQALPQTAGSLFTLKGSFDFENPAEKVITHRFLDNGTKLWMLGTSTIQLWDVANKKVTSSRRHEIEELEAYSLDELSPDNTKLFYTRRKRIDFGRFMSAYVFDLGSLKQIQVFEPSTLISGGWSKNGKIFYTVSDEPKTDKKDDVKNLLVSFRDGETLAPLRTISIQDLDWWYLSPDGEQFFTTSVPTKKWLGLIPNEMANKATTITVWNTKTGQVAKKLSVGDEDFGVLTWKLMPSPSGRYMAMVSKHKSKEEEHRILFWELNGSDAPKYSIKADPRLSDSNIRYSPDERFFAVDSGKNIQVYQSETGQKKGEILNTNLPDYWLPGDQLLFTTFAKKMRAFSVATGNMIYENPLIYESYSSSSTDVSEDTTSTETIVTDQTVVVPHPNGKVYMTYSNQYVKLYKADSGELIETVVQPPLTVVKLKRAIREKQYVSKAGWSEDGKTLWVINADETAMSLWDFKG
ncbi:MAG TPA: WD40 repeat domain-containing protein [Pyrinomonadaceae bacterium]|jgi:WD40 repeat protein|nr:WD40 repeat domain-containing protein [Pyrinomonadaceae bacterium]